MWVFWLVLAAILAVSVVVTAWALDAFDGIGARDIAGLARSRVRLRTRVRGVGRRLHLGGLAR